MPNKPTTLREEFKKEFPENQRVWRNTGLKGNMKLVSIEEIFEWFTSHNTQLLRKIEGLYETDCSSYECCKRDVISIINQEK